VTLGNLFNNTAVHDIQYTLSIYCMITQGKVVNINSEAQQKCVLCSKSRSRSIQVELGKEGFLKCAAHR